MTIKNCARRTASQTHIVFIIIEKHSRGILWASSSLGWIHSSQENVIPRNIDAHWPRTLSLHPLRSKFGEEQGLDEGQQEEEVGEYREEEDMGVEEYDEIGGQY